MKRNSTLIWLLAGLALLVGLNLVSNPAFLKITLHEGHVYGVPIDILTQGSRTMLLALGMTLVIATGGVDLSVGSVVAIAGAVCALLLNGGAGLATTIVAAMGVGALAGGVNGVLVARHENEISPSQRGDMAAEITAFLEAGVDGFFTDDPAIGRSALDAFLKK